MPASISSSIISKERKDDADTTSNSYADSVHSYENINRDDNEQQPVSTQLSRHLTQILSEEGGKERLESMARVISTKTKAEMDKFEVNDMDFDLRMLLNYLRNRQLEQGIEPGDSGVAFKNLTAVGIDASAAYGPSVEEMLRDTGKLPLTLINKLRRKKDSVPLRNIIQNCTGVVESGEMLFVVGRPGAGCSTLLKCISGETSELVSVDGEFSYDGLDQAEMMKNYKGYVIYCPELEIGRAHV